MRCLYVHVPFCARKCEYCAFFSETSTAELRQRYVEALLRELAWVAPSLEPHTVFFGGGTPSLLSVHDWDRILTAMHRLFPRAPQEWTVECNPATLSLDKARLLISGGVNRVSLGVQSLDETLLDRLGRVHNRAMVFRSFDLLRRAGFANLNLDLMFAIPGQTMVHWQDTLREAMAMESEHLSCYEVTYEEDTPLFEQLQAGRIDADEALACDMYEELRDTAARRGFDQYEVANFARRLSGETGPIPERACRHNINYWRGGSFHGLGPSASGFVEGVRTRNWANTLLYCERLEQGQRAIESSDILSPLARAGEIAAFGLRMVIGWRYAEFRTVTGFDLRDDWKAAMDELVARGWGDRDSDGFRLTRDGLRFADAAAELFLRSRAE